MKRWLYRIAGAANALLMSLVALIAFALMLCGVYVLNDIMYTNRSAFVSYDLLQYRPAPHDSTDDAMSFSALQEINEDTVGWLEMFGTHINYPVMKGRDDLEYLNKDIYGYSTMSGSIYLSAGNESRFNDWYNLIYGHHMESGAMFGDIARYMDPVYFDEHSEGILQTTDGDYHVRVIACIRTDAYEDIVYNIQPNAESQYPALCEYIRTHSVNQTQLPETLDHMRLLGMSTCTDAVTNGRIVLYACVTPWDTETDGDAAERMTSAETLDAQEQGLFSRQAVGHRMSRSKWSILNLLCVLCTFLTFVPLWAPRTKFRQLSFARRQSQAEDTPRAMASDLRRFLNKARWGLAVEALLTVLSVIVFLLTQDLDGRMTIEDSWTGIMLLLEAAALVTDFICLRYRGVR